MTKMKSISLIELPRISAIFLLSNPLTSHFAEIITEKTPAQRAGACQCLNLLQLLMLKSVYLCCSNIHDPTTSPPLKPRIYSLLLAHSQLHVLL